MATGDRYFAQHALALRQNHRVGRPGLGVAVLLLLIGAQTSANPTGGTVVGGNAAITQTPGVTTVDQKSDRAIINWRGFNIDPGELTRFNQPGRDAIALNRVVGAERSKIFGKLQANGQVWLINPNGILFGPSAQVDVHGLLATTSDIDDTDFLAGNHDFSIPSPVPEASVVNEGSITIDEAGLAGLVAPYVRNSGVISGRLGKVVLAGAPTFTVDFYGDGLIQFAATSKVTEAANATEALVQNDGRINAEGGSILITANAAAEVVDEVINTRGIIEAHSASKQDGVIVLDGGKHGIVRVAGQLDASGTQTEQQGGRVAVLGEKVGLFEGAVINVSGDAGAGEVLVGGNYQGRGPEPNAMRTYVAEEATIAADAITDGDGGRVIVWSDEVTNFYGHISARGGAEGGDGGFAEVSGKQLLSFEGTVDLTSATGEAGTLLLDPPDLEIRAGGPDGQPAARTEDFFGIEFTPGSTTSFLDPAVLVSALNEANVTVNTVFEEGPGEGDIRVLEAITAGPNANDLRLNAHDDVIVQAPIDFGASSGSVNLDARGIGAEEIGSIEVNADVTTASGRLDLFGDNITIQGSLITSGSGDSGTTVVDFLSFGTVVVGASGRVEATTGTIDVTIFGEGSFSNQGSVIARDGNIEVWAERLNISGPVEAPQGEIRLSDTDLNTLSPNEIAFLQSNQLQLHRPKTRLESKLDLRQFEAVSLVGSASAAAGGRILVNNLVIDDSGGMALGIPVDADGDISATLNDVLTEGGPIPGAFDLQGAPLRATGSITITTDGAFTSDGQSALTAGDAITITAGLGTFGSGDVTIAGPVNSESSLTITTPNGSVANSGAGRLVGESILLQANENVLVNANSDAARSFTIDADTDGNGVGSIATNGATLSAGGALRLSAGNGISIRTAAVNNISAATTNGSISINNLSDIATTGIRGENGQSGLAAPNGAVRFTSAGPLLVGEGGVNAGDIEFDVQGSLTVNEPMVATFGETITLRINGPLFLNAPLSSPGPGDAIVIETDSFVNTVGQNALRPGNGRFLVYSVDPRNDTRNGIIETTQKRYGRTFANDPPASLTGPDEIGDLFLYEVLPTLSIAADDAFRVFRTPNPALTFTAAGLIDSDTLADGLSESPVLSTTARRTSAPGRYPIQVGPATISSPLGYALELLDGTLIVRDVRPGNKIKPDVPVNTKVKPPVPLVLIAPPRTVFDIADVEQVVLEEVLFANDGNREVWGPSLLAPSLVEEE